ncbi:low molecular weight protein arginine phosphatase [Bacillus dakarensis]|uniref:low molecular weight protein arginine phosphatase n=1 Tax=Robertmurraya dakarensis TaxID=1926278 RepID=UPI0009812B06|nr:low molecular weight protein arginine phosphatase [Bacillus dakarensis]
MIRILFVCTGNTCRSPMAEAILKSKGIPGIEVKSAGVFAANGASASQHTQTVLKEQNITHDHRSSMLTEESVNWATYILTMTWSHKDSINNMFPMAAGKTFTLKEFAEGDSYGDISDPFGGPLELYRQTYKELHDIIDKIIKKIEKAGDS